jgi:hypothetical protein
LSNVEYLSDRELYTILSTKYFFEKRGIGVFVFETYKNVTCNRLQTHRSMLLERFRMRKRID